MEVSIVTYIGDLQSRSVHLKSGESILTEAPVDNEGKGMAFSPTDLMATSLAQCMMTIMGIISKRHSIQLEGTCAHVTKIMGTEPRRVVEIIIDFRFPDTIVYSNKEQTLLKQAALNCPVSKSLHPDLKQTVNFYFNL